jgi:hypothetical protein
MPDISSTTTIIIIIRFIGHLFNLSLGQ